MEAEVFMPYLKGASLDIKDNMNGFYKTDNDYADALTAEDAENSSLVSNAARNRSFNSNIYYQRDNAIGRNIEDLKDKYVYAKGLCRLLTPTGDDDETVDSMIDKFVSQKEFLLTIHFNTAKFDDLEPEFEEELRMWAKETINILMAGNDMVKKGLPKYDRDVFIEKNIPRRQLRLSFLNKSNKRVNFILKDCEIERKIAKNRYLLYVKRMEILK